MDEVVLDREARARRALDQRPLLRLGLRRVGHGDRGAPELDLAVFVADERRELRLEVEDLRVRELELVLRERVRVELGARHACGRTARPPARIGRDAGRLALEDVLRRLAHPPDRDALAVDVLGYLDVGVGALAPRRPAGVSTRRRRDAGAHLVVA